MFVPLRSILVLAVALLAGTAAFAQPSGSTAPGSAAAGSPVPKSTTLVVGTDRGDVRGTTGDGVEQFLGIPYAAAPVGALRWAAPREPAPWSGIRAADAVGRPCPQPHSFDAPDGPLLDEDCLFINVERPPGTRADAKLPVFVYIHGGGFVTGSGSKDLPDRVVASGHAVGVSFNYRLGALGFLALPGADGAASDGPTGEDGLLDQQAALRWVGRNIAAFGGDPSRVTISGESAGGWSVCAALATPGDRTLFAGAIMQSGSCISRSLAAAEAAGTRFARAVGCDDPAQALACLRGKPVAALLAAAERIYVPTSGTTLLPDPPGRAVAGGRFAHVPMIVGTTRDEGRSFSRDKIGWDDAQYTAYVRHRFGALAPAVLASYPYPHDATDRAAVAYQVGAIETDDGALGADAVEAGIGGCGDLALTRTLARAVPVHAYEFAPRDGPGWFPTPNYRWGAGHAAELTYLYPRHDGGRTTSGFSPGERRLAAIMAGEWNAFTRTANPNGAGLPDWPGFNATGAMLALVATEPPHPMAAVAFRAEHHCAFWDRHAGAPLGH